MSVYPALASGGGMLGLGSILKGLNPQMLIFAIPFLFMALQAGLYLSS